MSLLRSSFITSFFTLIARVFGYVRDIMVASRLGASALADVFLVAFRLPNMFRSIFAEGAFNAAFVPILSGMVADKSLEKAKDFVINVFNLLAIVLIIFIAIAELLMPVFVYAISSGFATEEWKFNLTTDLTRITFPYLLFISLTAMLCGILYSVGKFAAASATPIILNLSLVGTLLFFTEANQETVFAMAWAVFFAGILQLLWVIQHCRKNGFKIKLGRPKLTPEIRKVLRNLVPIIIGSGVVQINILVNTQIASYMEEAVSLLYYAERISQFPLAIIGTAIGTAMLPLLSRQIKQQQKDKANATQNKAIGLSMGFTIPASVGIFILAEPIITTLFQRGQFTTLDAYNSALALKAFAFGIPAFVLIKIFTNSFYANQNTKTPVRVAIICIIINIISNLCLIGEFGYLALAISTSFSAWINSCILLYILIKNKNIKLIPNVKKHLALITFSSAIMGLVVYYLIQSFGLNIIQFTDIDLTRFSNLIVYSLAGFATYAIIVHFAGTIKFIRSIN